VLFNQDRRRGQNELAGPEVGAAEVPSAAWVVSVERLNSLRHC
jgi:hypothetical protein